MTNRITARKFGGDDQGSWAVFIDGRTFVTGLVRSEVAHYKRLAEDQLTPKTPCWICNGKGTHGYGVPCSNCRGTGRA